jgi:hypothetical protein
MYQSFQTINDALPNAVRNNLSRAVIQAQSSADAVVSVATSTIAEYARLYSQVQRLKYDTAGNVTDVTPANELTVPASAIATLKESMNDLNKLITWYSSMPDQFQISGSGLELQINGHSGLSYSSVNPVTTAGTVADDYLGHKFDDDGTMMAIEFAKDTNQFRCDIFRFEPGEHIKYARHTASTIADLNTALAGTGVTLTVTTLVASTNFVNVLISADWDQLRVVATPTTMTNIVPEDPLDSVLDGWSQPIKLALWIPTSTESMPVTATVSQILDEVIRPYRPLITAIEQL